MIKNNNENYLVNIKTIQATIFKQVIDALKDILIPGLPDFEWTIEYTNFLENPTDDALRISVENKLRNFAYFADGFLSAVGCRLALAALTGLASSKPNARRRCPDNPLVCACRTKYLQKNSLIE